MAAHNTTRSVTRREFNAASITALFVGMTVWVGGCGKGSDSMNYASSPTPIPTPTPTSTRPGDKTATIAGNHGHVATVTSAQLQASGAVALSIRGSADHDHTVELSSEQVRDIAAGSRVTRNSSQADGTSDGYGGTTPGHAHAVTFN